MASILRPLYPQLRAWPANSVTALVGQLQTNAVEPALKRPKSPSTKAFCVGLPGAMSCQSTLWFDDLRADRLTYPFTLLRAVFASDAHRDDSWSAPAKGPSDAVVQT